MDGLIKNAKFTLCQQRESGRNNVNVRGLARCRAEFCTLPDYASPCVGRFSVGVGKGLGLGVVAISTRGCIIWQGCRFRHNTCNGCKLNLQTLLYQTTSKLKWKWHQTFSKDSVPSEIQWYVCSCVAQW